VFVTKASLLLGLIQGTVDEICEQNREVPDVNAGGVYTNHRVKAGKAQTC
jgi:hypothetical protein